MWRANVYSLESLTPEAREGINDGIGMVAAYMGQTVTTKELIVRLPRNSKGNVKPLRVGFGKLDKMVELHLMAVPLDRGVEEKLGLAWTGRGLGFVDVTSNSATLIRATTSHETAHSLGYVLPDAEQADPADLHHCLNNSCLMHEGISYAISDEPVFAKGRLKRAMQTAGLRGTSYEPRINIINGQFDFCMPCKLDLRDKGEEQIRQLRFNRLFTWDGCKIN